MPRWRWPTWVLATPQTRPASLFLKGDLLMSAGKHEEAAAAFAASYQQAPSRELAMRQVAACSSPAGKTDEAAKALDAWVVREPSDLPAAANLAQLEIALGRTAQAEARLKPIVAAQPADAVSLNNLAWLMQLRADPATDAGKATLAEARRIAERARHPQPSPETSDTLGWVLARQGEAQAALPLLRAAAAATVAQRRADPDVLPPGLRAARQRAARRGDQAAGAGGRRRRAGPRARGGRADAAGVEGGG